MMLECQWVDGTARSLVMKTRAKRKPDDRQRPVRPITQAGGASSRPPTPSPAAKRRPPKKKPRTRKRASQTPKPGRTPSNDILKQLFPLAAQPDRRFGVGVLIAMVTQEGTAGELQYVRAQRFATRPGLRPKAAVLALAAPKHIARLMAGFAHPDRVLITQAVISGANTHHALSEALGLKTGPLYHHIRALERAGILRTPGRNMYELTELGRVALFAATLLAGWDRPGKKIWHVRQLRSKKRPAK